MRCIGTRVIAFLNPNQSNQDKFIICDHSNKENPVISVGLWFCEFVLLSSVLYVGVVYNIHAARDGIPGLDILTGLWRITDYQSFSLMQCSIDRPVEQCLVSLSYADMPKLNKQTDWWDVYCACCVCSGTFWAELRYVAAVKFTAQSQLPDTYILYDHRLL